MRDITPYIHPEDRQKQAHALKEAIATGRDYFCEFRFVRPDDQKVMWLEVQGKVIQDDDGRPARVWGVVLDRTEKVLLEKELSEQTKIAHRLSQRKSEFVAIVAHELRNPLAPIKGCISVLSDPRAEDQYKESALQIIRRQAEAIERLIEDLLDISRIEQGKIAYQPAQTDLAKLIEKAVETANPHFETKAQHLFVELPAEPLHVNVDERRMVQVVSNLLNNASKFTSREGAISVSVYRQEAEAVIAVKDNGVGITSEDLKSIFEPFFQSANVGARGDSGLGLGLSLSSALVKLHGGTIEAQSEGLGKGSEFIVRLPLASGTS